LTAPSHPKAKGRPRKLQGALGQEGVTDARISAHWNGGPGTRTARRGGGVCRTDSGDQPPTGVYREERSVEKTVKTEAQGKSRQGGEREGGLRYLDF